MLVSVGLILIGIAVTFYVTHLIFVSHFYHHSFGPNMLRKPLWRVDYEYSTIVSWCQEQGTLPHWVKKLGSLSMLLFFVGVLWCAIAVFVYGPRPVQSTTCWIFVHDRRRIRTAYSQRG